MRSVGALVLSLFPSDRLRAHTLWAYRVHVTAAAVAVMIRDDLLEAAGDDQLGHAQVALEAQYRRIGDDRSRFGDITQHADRGVIEVEPMQVWLHEGHGREHLTKREARW